MRLPSIVRFPLFVSVPSIVSVPAAWSIVLSATILPVPVTVELPPRVVVPLRSSSVLSLPPEAPPTVKLPTVTFAAVTGAVTGIVMQTACVEPGRPFDQLPGVDHAPPAGFVQESSQAGPAAEAGTRRAPAAASSTSTSSPAPEASRSRRGEPAAAVGPALTRNELSAVLIGNPLVTAGDVVVKRRPHTTGGHPAKVRRGRHTNVTARLQARAGFALRFGLVDSTGLLVACRGPCERRARARAAGLP